MSWGREALRHGCQCRSVEEMRGKHARTWAILKVAEGEVELVCMCATEQAAEMTRLAMGDGIHAVCIPIPAPCPG